MPNQPKDPIIQPSEDRPLECSECKKPVAVRYTEVVGNTITHTIMCADCPQLERRLHGIPSGEAAESKELAGLCCGNCDTTLDSVRMGSLLGCAVCYDVFEDILLGELKSRQKIPKHVAKKKTAPLHIGRIPGESEEMTPSVRLMALNEALNETLKYEDYEQAAWLRDQINEITECSDEK